MLETAMERLSPSARAYDRILKVARTIAGLEERDDIGPEHVAEAIQDQSLDRAPDDSPLGPWKRGESRRRRHIPSTRISAAAGGARLPQGWFAGRTDGGEAAWLQR